MHEVTVFILVWGGWSGVDMWVHMMWVHVMWAHPSFSISIEATLPWAQHTQQHLEHSSGDHRQKAVRSPGAKPGTNAGSVFALEGDGQGKYQHLKRVCDAGKSTGP